MKKKIMLLGMATLALLGADACDETQIVDLKGYLQDDLSIHCPLERCPGKEEICCYDQEVPTKVLKEAAGIGS